MFGTFSEWGRYTCEALTTFVKGLYAMAYAFIAGLVSLFAGLWRSLVYLVGKYPSIALGGFLVAVIIAWLVTFMTMRARAIGAEAQRDSIAWQYTDFKEKHGYE